MKIVVRDSQESTLGSINISIRDIGGGLEKIAVKSLSAVSRPRSGGRTWERSSWSSGQRSRTTSSGRISVAPAVRREVADVPARHPARPDHTHPVARTPTRPNLTARPAESATTSQATSRQKGREIRITLPALRAPKVLTKPAKRLFNAISKYALKPLKRQFLKLPGKIRVASAAAAFVLLLVGAHGLFAGNNQPEVKAAASRRQPLTRGTPNYPTVLPAGKTIGDLGGWVRISPPSRNPVYAYADMIGGVRIDVSEQPMPPPLQNNTPEQMAKLAQSYSANGTLTANGTTVYIGTSVKGPQSLILTQNNLLILIKSASPLTDKQWVDYINSLH